MDFGNVINCPSFKPHKSPKKLVFLLHGYGDNGDNFIPLSKYINDNNFKINFFAPNAPSVVPQYPSGFQWFNLYPNGKYFEDAGPEEVLVMKKDCIKTLEILKEYIDKSIAFYDLNYKDCFIIGFSQGAMIAYELGQYLNKNFAGIIMLSGRIISSENNEKNFFIKTPLMIVHGDQDNVVNSKYFDEACNILTKEKFVFEQYLMKSEGHTVSLDTLQLIKNFIKKNV